MDKGYEQENINIESEEAMDQRGGVYMQPPYGYPQVPYGYPQPPYGYPYPRKRSMNGAPGGSYCCADGEWVFLSIGDPTRSAIAIHKMIGHPELSEDPRYMGPNRRQYMEEYYGIIREAFLQRTAEEWIRLGTAADIPILRMAHFSDIAEDPQAWENGFVEHVEFSNGNTDVMPTCPIEMNTVAAPPTVPPPGVGADTEAVLRSLGYSEEQIGQMLLSGAAVVQ